MRVTVNYGVSFEEIPKLLQDMLGECDDLREKIDSLLSVVSYALSTENLDLVKGSAHDLRVTTAEIDARMGDFLPMVEGYINAKRQMIEQEEVQPSPPSEVREATHHPKVKTFDHLKSSTVEPEDSQSDDITIIDSDDSDK